MHAHAIALEPAHVQGVHCKSIVVIAMHQGILWVGGTAEEEEDIIMFHGWGELIYG